MQTVASPEALPRPPVWQVVLGLAGGVLVLVLAAGVVGVFDPPDPAFNRCVSNGVSTHKAYGSGSRFSDGRDMEQVVRERCARNSGAYPTA